MRVSFLPAGAARGRRGAEEFSSAFSFHDRQSVPIGKYGEAASLEKAAE